jgi:hypothetical protein
VRHQIDHAVLLATVPLFGANRALPLSAAKPILDSTINLVAADLACRGLKPPTEQWKRELDWSK